MSKKLEVKPSKIHGTGLFLKESFVKGAFIARIPGKLSTVKRQLLNTPEEALMHPNWVGISMSYWIDPDIPFKYLNHSCDPTCGIKEKTNLYALRNLKAGDEVTIDYSTIEGNPYWQIKCSCGLKNCRRIIRSIAYLPKSNFKKYYPFIPTVFRNFYIKYKNLSLEKNPWLKNKSIKKNGKKN